MWLAAAAMGAATATGSEPPTAISGRVVMPGGPTAAVTVVARAFDGPSQFRIDLDEGQSSYRLEVPAGRYVVFAVPRDPADARRGAYTSFSLCHRIVRQGGRTIRPCTTSPPITVEVAPGAERRDIDIDDWRLKPEVAATLQLSPTASGR